MAIGLAFVDIVGDTSRTEQQVERDMNLVLAEVQSNLDPVEINTEIDRSRDPERSRDLRDQIASLQALADAHRVNPHLGAFDRHDAIQSLNNQIAILQAEADELVIQVDTPALVDEVTEAVHVAEELAPPIEIETKIDNDKVARDFSALSGIAGAALGAIGPLAGLAKNLVAVGAAGPAIAGVVGSLASMAPAAAVAAPAIFTVISANAALKIGLLGVGDAVKAAFDPSDPEAYAEALKKLSPNAREFVKSLQSLKPELDGLKKQVQDNLFDTLGKHITAVGKNILPTFRKSLADSAVSLNIMAHGVLGAADGLQQSGALGKALSSANTGLTNLSNIPGRIVTALGELGAAAGPTFEKLTAAAGKGVDGLIGKLDEAFKSGKLQEKIEGAAGQFKLLVGVLKDVGHILDNVFTIASQFSGTGLGGIKALADTLREFTETRGFQNALINLFTAAQQVTQTALPLLSQALGEIGPILTALLPGFHDLVAALGPALSQVIGALGPVLKTAAQAITAIAFAVAPVVTLLGQLLSTILPALSPVLLAAATAITSIVTAVAPLLTVLSQLIVAVLPVLTPLLSAVDSIFQALAPVIEQVAGILSAALVPVITALATNVLPPLVSIFVTFVSNVLPIFSKLLEALTPAIETMSGTFVSLTEALGPVLEAFAELIGPLLSALTPILIPIIEFVGKLATILAGTLAMYINTIVVPALKAVTALLKGDFSGAWENAKQAVKGLIDFTIQLFVRLPFELTRLISELGSALADAAREAFGKFRDAAINKITNDFLPWVANLKMEILNKLGNLDDLLSQAGRLLIQGLMNGIRSKLGELRGLLGSVTSLIPDWKGPADKDATLLTPAGRSIMQGLMAGIGAEIPALQSQLGGITSLVGGTSMGLGAVGGPTFPGGSPVSAAAFAGSVGTPSSGTTPSVQVFIGQQELTQLVDARVSTANRVIGRQIQNGVRF